MARDKSFTEPIVQALESASVLDAPSKLLSGPVKAALSPGAVKDALSGTWLGHALHPVLTDVVITAFLGATVADVVGGEKAGQVSERMIMIGIGAYLPTALSGASDWVDAEVDERVRRVGIVHAVGNSVALSLYSASLAARRQGSTATGRLLAGAGATALMVGGFLGGHLSMRRGIGPDQTVFDPGPQDWKPAADSSALPERRPTHVVVEDTPVLLYRDGDEVYAIHDRCSHRGCPLSDGEVEGYEIVCGCHSSRFDMRDGSLVRGPATAPQPSFETRVQDSIIQIRLRTP